MTDSTTATKPCRFCKVEYPATREYFRRSGKNGVSNQCKKCTALIESGKMVPINPFAPKDGMRGCKTCLRRLPDTSEYFYIELRNPNWTAHECRECATRRHGKYNADNHDWLLEYQREWRKSNPQRVLSYFRQYRAKHTEQVAKWQRDWYEANPERARMHWLNRQARKRALPDTLSPDETKRMLEYWGGACAISGETENIHFDHWIPLASPNCPGTVATNMIPLVDYLNFSKNDSDPAKWVRLNFGDDADEILSRIQAYFEWVKEQTS